MKAYMPFLLWDLEKGETWVQPKKKTCRLSLLKMVPADSGQREVPLIMWSVQLSSELIQ